jgi:hypothetical protein
MEGCRQCIVGRCRHLNKIGNRESLRSLSDIVLQCPHFSYIVLQAHKFSDHFPISLPHDV